jgi:hypothetical protein
VAIISLCIAVVAVIFLLHTYQMRQIRNVVTVPISEPDATTSQSAVDLGNGFSKDASHVYLNERIVPNADPGSFVEIPKSLFVKDAYSVWYVDKSGYPEVVSLVKGADPKTFTPIVDGTETPGWWGKDDTSIFVGSINIPGVDLKTLYLNIPNDPNRYFAKDKNHVYYLEYFPGSQGASVIPKIDPASFQVIDDGVLPNRDNCAGIFPVIGDKNGLYNEDKGGVWNTFEGSVDPATFKQLGWNYSKDKNHVWYESAVIQGANPTTFKMPSDLGCG